MNPNSDAPEPVLLMIADISGYTRFMTANAKTLAHSQAIITELVKAIIKQIELPLEVAKLEGDAIFFFCRKQNESPRWYETKQVIGKNLIAFFRMFSEKITELSQSNTCNCQACANIDKLRLKVIVHSGEALFHRILNFVELAGVDVIIVHRLLKNSVDAEHYLLLTEAARGDVEFVEAIQLNGGTETYEDIGQIKTMVYLPGDSAANDGGAVEISFPDRFRNAWDLRNKLWFAPLKRRSPPSQANGAGRIAFALLTVILTPIYLPVGTIFVLFHAMQKPARIHRHKPDGSCGCGH